MKTKASLNTRIMWFVFGTNPDLNGIKLIYHNNPEEEFSSFIKFEFKLNSDHITGFWSPTYKAFEIVKKNFEKIFEIKWENVHWNNTRTIFWFKPLDYDIK